MPRQLGGFQVNRPKYSRFRKVSVYLISEKPLASHFSTKSTKSHVSSVSFVHGGVGEKPNPILNTIISKSEVT